MARRAGDPDASAAPGPTGSSVLYASSASSSVADVGATGRPVNKWFNLNLEEIGSVREEVKPWRHAAVTRHPPPMFIEVCLDVSRVSAADSLHVTDIHGRPWTVDLERSLQSGAGAAAAASESGSIRRRRRARRATAIVLEVWRLDLDTAAVITPAPDLPRVYKQAIVFFRSLYAFASLLPCMTLARQIGAGAGGLALFCQFRAEPSARAGVVDLDVGLTNTARFLESHSFGPVVTPMGTFSMGVQYRRECIFSSSSPQDDALHDSIAGLDAVDDTYFTPTLSSRSGSNFSAHPQRHGLPMEPLREAASMGPGNNNLHAMRRAHTAVSPEPHSQRHAPHGSSLSGEWGLTAPSINPFRARPLSVGDSASLPSYIGSVLHQQTLARQPSDSRPSNAGLPGAVRIPAASAEPHRALLGSRGHASRLSHQGHSPDHRSSLLSSSAAAAAEAGSSLHRSAILRRLGGPTSPAEPQRRLDLISRSSGNEPFVGSKSPPRPGASSFRSISSGSAGSIPTGRSVLGVAPFKSPSLAESPGLGLGMFADIGALAAHAASNEHSGTAGDASRRHGHTVPHGGSLRESGSAAEALLATATRVSGSPSSFGTNASGHSRRLSSSFGNRRTSAEARRTSILGMSVTERPGTS
ncbi:autophagy protein 13, partial [Coemansia helicoidea]